MATGTVLIPVQTAKISGAFITAGARIDGGDGAWKVLFATDSTEEALYQFEVPQNYASSPVLQIKYAMASATSNKVDMECKVMSLADGEDVDTASFDTLNEISGGTTVPGTAGFRDTISLTLTNNDSMAASETLFLHIQRDHDDADDTAAGDLELIGLALEYTTT
jgi:hypothetical protein